MKSSVSWTLLLMAIVSLAFSFFLLSGCAMFKKEEPTHKIESVKDFMSSPKPESPNAHY